VFHKQFAALHALAEREVLVFHRAHDEVAGLPSPTILCPIPHNAARDQQDRIRHRSTGFFFVAVTSESCRY
jgi:hypothetical protein